MRIKYIERRLEIIMSDIIIKEVVLRFAASIARRAKLSLEEIRELVQTDGGISKLIGKLVENPREYYTETLGLIFLIYIAKDDNITQKYLLDNEKVFNEIEGEAESYSYIRRILLNIKEDELKEKLLFKYFFTMIGEDWRCYKTPLAPEDLIKIIFSLNSQESIRRMFENEQILSILNYAKSERQREIIEVINSKETDKEKRKCIIPEVLKFLEPHQINRIIIPIESDLLKKECISDKEISPFLTKEKNTNRFGIYYHSFACIVASYKEDSYKEEEIEKGLEENTLDGKDLAIIISSLKSEAKKRSYLNDKRVTPKLSFEDKAMIIESLHEEDADEIKFGFIKETYSEINKTIDPSYIKGQDLMAKVAKMLGINLEQITNIICSMTDSKKKECLRDKEIAELLTFENICKIITAFENDEEKYIFVRENIKALNEAYYRQLREIVFSMRAKYKRKCLEDEVIASILKSNENDNYGRIKIIDIITSNYDYCFPEYVYRGKEKYSNLSEEERQQELIEEDNLRVEFLLNNIEELSHEKICRIVEAINVKETKAALLIDSEIYGRLMPSEQYRIYHILGKWNDFIKLYDETTNESGVYWTGPEEKRPKCNIKWKR